MPVFLKLKNVITSVITFISAIGLAASFDSVQAASDTIIINELMAGRPGESKQEFIELYNLSSSAIDLSGWKLTKKTKGGTESNLVSSAKMAGTVKPEGYIVIAHPDYADAIGADLVYSGGSYSFAQSNTILLYDDDGNLIDKVGFGEAGDYEEESAHNPESGQSLNRSGHLDSDDNGQDFSIGQPSPGSENIGGGSGEGENTKTGTVATSSAVLETEKQAYVPTGAVVINELVMDPVDGEKEWLELYNRGRQEIVIDDWYLELSSGARTKLKGSIGLDAGNYLLITDLNGYLANGGGQVTLFSGKGDIIDQVAYGGFADGFALDNAPAAPDPRSLARIRDGYKTFVDQNDFAATFTKTPAKPNLISDHSGQIIKSQTGLYCPLRINEILPRPAGSEEFLEIVNKTEEPVSSDGYNLHNSSGQSVYISGEIEANDLAAYYWGKEFVCLDLGDTIEMYNARLELCQVLTYPAAVAGRSWAWSASTQAFAWSTVPTPDAPNVIIWPNRPPVAHFSFSEAVAGRPVRFGTDDSFDPDDDLLDFYWDFGDGFSNVLPAPEHTFWQAGEYEVVLEVNDGELQSSSTRRVIVAPGTEPLPTPAKESKPTVTISEVMPNPAGSDSDGEWLELFNYGYEPVSLAGWSIDDAEGGSRPFMIGDLIVEPRNYIVLEREETALAFNNTVDEVRLFDRSGRVVASTSYSGVKEGLSWTKDESGDWQWSQSGSPGAENRIIVAAAPARTKAAAAAKRAPGGYKEVDIQEIKNLALGSQVQTEGVVAVVPDIFGKQIFYIVGPEGGLQVYSYKQDFPALKIGDHLQVRGELSQVNGEYRLKTAIRADMLVIDSGRKPTAAGVGHSEINEDRLGAFIQVEGEVIEVKAANIYLDDGQDELLVYIKSATGINQRAFSEGDRLKVRGILSATRSGLRLLPRQPDDIELLNRPENAVTVLGADSSQDWALESQSSRFSAYLTIGLIFGILVLVIAVFKKNKQLQTTTQKGGQDGSGDKPEIKP